MKNLTKEDIINFIKFNKPFLRKEFGVKEITLFGSYARGEQNEFSDIDFYIDMEPNFFKKCKLIEYLERNFNKKVDIVRKHNGIRPRFIEEINRDGLYVR